MEFIALGVIIFVLVILFSGISIRNGITTAKNQAKRSWADVIAYERLKLKLMPELEKMLEAYKGHESGVLDKITSLRTALSSLSGTNASSDELKQVQLKTTEMLGAIKIVAEAYPDLKAADLFRSVMNQLSEAEDNIAAAITNFNGSVQAFNNAIETFPGDWINARYNKEQRLNEFTDSQASKDVEYQPNI